MPASRRNDHPYVATLSHIAVSTSKAPTSTAPRAGPTKTMMFSMLEETALLDVSSSGSCTSCGTRPAWAARNGDPATTASKAST